jgi:hypothetical protein
MGARFWGWKELIFFHIHEINPFLKWIPTVGYSGAVVERVKRWDHAAMTDPDEGGIEAWLAARCAAGR